MSDFQNFLDQMLGNIEINQDDNPVYERYDVFEEIRSQIITARNELGITQKELAIKSGLTQANMSKIEKGLSQPTINTLLKLSDALDKRLIIRFVEPEGGILDD